MVSLQENQVVDSVGRMIPTAVDDSEATQKQLPMSVVHPWHVDRADISFRNTARDEVQIAVTVHNHAAKWSPPTTMVLRAAILGAFVPWRPLASLGVPEIEPWGHIRVATYAHQRRPAALGRFEHLTAQHLLDAIAQSEVWEQVRGVERRALARLRSRIGDHRRPDVMRSGTPDLPEDLFQILGRPNLHWAGNIDVFIGAHDVERHGARALRIYPTRTNLAVFAVGSGTDAYAFHVTGVESDWKFALHAAGGGTVLADLDNTRQIALLRWMSGRDVRFVQFSVCPPEGCGKGEVAVHVTQQSTGKQAVVEFSLDPQAAGSGCMTL